VASAGLALIGALVVVPSGSPSAWLGVAVGGAATYVLVGPPAVWLSALFPRAADLSKTGSGGNPHMLAAFVGFLVVSVAALPAAAILAVAIALGRPALMVLLMLAWLAAATAISLPLVQVASRAVGLRRENLSLVSQER
jgi:hypothetical protein